MTDFVSRVIKIDAVTLDSELLSLIKRQLFHLLESFQPTSWIQRYGPEVELILKFLIWKIRRPLRYVENGLKVCHVVNFCAFLIENRYPTLSYRLARLNLIPAQQRVHPSVGYSYQIRELLWHQFADFLMIVLPLINIHRLKKYVTVLGRRKPSNSRPASMPQNPNIVLKCCLCLEDAILPQRHNSCTFCYYCIRSNLTADPNFQCTTCEHNS